MPIVLSFVLQKVLTYVKQVVQSGTACYPLRSSLNSSKLCRFYIQTRLDRCDDYPLLISLRSQTCWISRRTGLHVAVEWSFWTVLVPWELHLLHCANYCCFHLYPVGVDSYTWHYHLFIKLKSQKITCEQSANANNVYCVRLCSMQAAPRYQHLSLFLCEQQHLVLWLFVSFLFSLRQLCHL